MFKIILIISVSLFVMCESFGVARTAGTCPSIKLKNGRTRYRQKGRFAKFMCATGYLIAGEKYSTCVNGSWDGPIPKCVRASCKKVDAPINALIYPSHRGAVLNFFCKPGYDLRGVTTLYCDGHYWDNSLPTCILTNTKPQLSCNFETNDLCGWNHDLRHDFDWTRRNLKTPSGHLGTGPSFDHTLGEGKEGYYMYIESSSRKINDTARLISPVYDKIVDSDVCFEFYYHMHGASTGELRVYLKRVSDPWILYPENSIFWKIGNHGDKWFRSFTQLGTINEDFQIIIEGVRGSSFYSDIAIDDISIIPNCTVIESTTERDIEYTIDYIPTQSCFNRCDSDNTTSINSDQMSCGCDDTCTDNNTCCPDYIALCVVGITDDNNVTTETTVVQQFETSSIRSTARVPNRRITSKDIQYNVSSSISTRTSRLSSTTVSAPPTTTKIRKNILTTLPPAVPPIKTSSTTLSPPKPPNLPIKPPIIPPSSPKNSSAPITPPTIPKNPPSIPISSPNPSINTSQLPLNPPSIPKNVPIAPEKPIKVPEKPANRSKIPDQPKVQEKLSTTLKPPIPVKPPVIPIKPQPVFTKSSSTSSSPVPKPPNFSKYVAKQSSSVVPPTTIIYDDVNTVSGLVDNRDNEEEGDIIDPVIFKDKESSNIQNEKIVKEAQSNSTTIVIVAVLSVFVIVAVTLGVTLLKRYQHTCKRRRMRGSSCESQSDVRFLTSDEVLDFNLAYDE